MLKPARFMVGGGLSGPGFLRFPCPSLFKFKHRAPQISNPSPDRLNFHIGSDFFWKFGRNHEKRKDGGYRFGCALLRGVVLVHRDVRVRVAHRATSRGVDAVECVRDRENDSVDGNEAGREAGREASRGLARERRLVSKKISLYFFTF